MAVLLLGLLLLSALCGGCCTLAPTPQQAYEQAAHSTISIYQPGRACSAALVATGVLTAAHCIGNPAEPVWARAGNAIVALRIVKIDSARDLALLVPQTPADAQALHSEYFNALQPCGTRETPPARLIAYGYPGYMGLALTAETGETWGYWTDPRTQTVLLVARDIGYPGESGGPVLDAETRCLAGLEHVYVGPQDGSNKTITMLVSAEEITHFLTN